MADRILYDGKLSRSKGFTLLELMVVMVLISLLTAFAIPKLRTSLFTDQLKTTTRKILGRISEARQEAVRRNTDYFLYFDLEQNSMSSIQDEKEDEKEEDEQSEAGSEYVIPDSVQVVDVMSVHGGKQTQGRAAIRFSKKGYVDKTLIHLRSDDDEDMTILLSPFLGVSKLFDAYVDLEDERVRY